MMIINLIACADLNSGIGFKNDLLVRLPKDLKRFKDLTKGKPCVMGRKTFESIGKPLSERENIVLTSNTEYQAEGIKVYHKITDILRDYQNSEIMVIGGEEIYQQFFPIADRIYLTVVYERFDEVDTYFPEVSIEEWDVVNHKEVEENGYKFNFLELINRQA